MTDLKPPLTGYSIWFLAEANQHRQLQNVVDELARRLDTDQFTAHGTVLGLLEYRETQHDTILANAKQLAANSPSFTLELIGTGKRNKYFQSVFFTAVPNGAVIELNEKARVAFGHQQDPPYMPHVSAVYGDLKPGTKQRAENIIHDLIRFPFEVFINRIAVVKNVGFPNEWEIIAEYPLYPIQS